MSRHIGNITIFRLFSLLILLGLCGFVQAQDMEPRRWTHLPVDLNVVGVVLGNSSGDITFDPVMRIEDGVFDLDIATVSYVHSFDLAGKSARMDIVVPFANGHWEGLVNGVDRQVRWKGLMNPWIRFSVNLYGAPALKGQEFMQYRAKHQTYTTVGAAIAVIMPLGKYDPEYLINLGDNRWTYRPQLGILHQREKIQVELTGSVFLYGDNDNYFRGNLLKRDPLWFIQSHLVYTINQKWWTSMGLGFAYGGRSSLNGMPLPDDARSSYMSLGLGVSLTRNQGLKISYLRNRTNIPTGSDGDTIFAGWTYSWFH